MTHPYHPLCGQAVEVIRVRRGVDPDFIIRHPAGFHTAIAMSWTDYAAPSPLPPQERSPVGLLDCVGLLQLARFLEALHLAGRFPPEAADQERRPDAL